MSQIGEMFNTPREELRDDVLLSDYSYFQREILKRGLDPLPGYIPLHEWRKTRTDAWKHAAYCSRQIPRGRIKDAVKIGTDWYVPIGAEPRKAPGLEDDDGLTL